MFHTSVGIWNLVNQTRKLDVVSKIPVATNNDAGYEPFLVKQNLKACVQRVAACKFVCIWFTPFATPAHPIQHQQL